MVTLIIKIGLRIVAVWVATYIVPGVSYTNLKALVIFALVLAALNTFIKPILKIITLPINIITLGLFSLVINTGMVLLAAKLVDGFMVSGFVSAFLCALVVAVMEGLLHLKD